MPINPDAVGAKGAPMEHSWTSTDALLYALGVGAGTEDLQFTTENSIGIEQRVLPTMAVVLATGTAGPIGEIGSFNPALLVHGSQSIRLHRELPTEGKVSTVGTVTGIYDKGSGALVVLEGESTDVATGEPLFTTTMGLFLRGEGGFGGDRGPSTDSAVPDRDPDDRITYTTREDQALLYRLSGDRNPLHSDPTFAAAAGFDRPILHGLCTYGFAGRALLRSLCEDDPSRFTSMEGRFAKPVFPGEELTTEIWRVGDGEAVFQTLGSDGRVVLDSGRCTFTS